MATPRMQTVTRCFELWTEGDFHAASEFFGADAEWHPQTEYLEPHIYKGREEIAAMLRSLGGHDELSMDFSRMEEVGEKVIVHVYARTMDDDAPDVHWFQLYTFVDGEIAKVEPFGSHEGAVAAAQG